MLHLLTGLPIGETLSFGDDQPWNADQADETYRDLLAQAGLDWVVDDPGGLDGRYTARLQLLDATEACNWRGDWYHPRLPPHGAAGARRGGPGRDGAGERTAATTTPTKPGAP